LKINAGDIFTENPVHRNAFRSTGLVDPIGRKPFTETATFRWTVTLAGGEWPKKMTA